MPISIKPERRVQEDQSVNENERHLLWGLIGSLQYAAVHTRPDLSSSLSHLQSEINKATVGTLITANKVLQSQCQETQRRHHQNKTHKTQRISDSLHSQMLLLHPKVSLNHMPE